MQSVRAYIGRDHYKTIVKTENNLMMADEPKDEGGLDLGFSPNELMAASLAACTVITLRMYADRKKWNLDSVELTVSIEWDKLTLRTLMKKKMRLNGNLSPAERKRLREIGDKCPTHKMLQHPIMISTEVENESQPA